MSTAVMTMASPVPKRSFDTALGPSTPDPSTRDKSLAAAFEAERGHTDCSNSTDGAATVPSYNSTPLSSPGPSPSPQQLSKLLPSTMPTDNDACESPNKKRKLTFQEKEMEHIQKQIEAQQRAEEKAKKAEEKRLKEELKKEEKRLKDEEKEKARLDREHKQKLREEQKKIRDQEKSIKDAEKQKKEAERLSEKQAKEEAKAKKERSQMRLGQFFSKQGPLANNSPSSSRRGSVASIDDEKLQATSRAESEAPAVRPPTEYEKAFAPFFLHAHTALAPATRFPWNEDRHAVASRQIDEAIGNAKTARESMEIDTPGLAKHTLAEILSLPAAKRSKQNLEVRTVRELVKQIDNGSERSPIDVESSEQTSRGAFDALRKVSVKFLKYGEDVRPPYVGTFTKRPTKFSATRLQRNPCLRAFELAAINYDYDSEAEWEEPEEGEELNSDEEDDEDDGEDQEMDDFLDDEDDAANPKRRHHMGEMEPVCSGLLWSDFSGAHAQPPLGKIPFGNTELDLRQLRIAPLLESATGPIDPYSTSYWTAQAEPEAECSTMPPPRGPLNPIASGNKMFLGNAAPGKMNPGKTKGAAAKPLPKEFLDDFKKAVDGSDLSKVGLIEVLKKKFPQVTSKTIQSTLVEVAKREGKKESEKKWVLI